MNDYHINAYSRIMDIITLLSETDAGITINVLAEKYEVDVNIILDDIRNIITSEELGFVIFPCDEKFDQDDFYEQLILGKLNDIEIYGQFESVDESLSIQLSAFEKIFLTSFLNRNGVMVEKTVNSDIYIKKLYHYIDKNVLVNLKQISQAIKKGLSIHMIYPSENMKEERILVTPIKVVKLVANELYYMLAQLNQNICYYRMDKIIKIECVEKNEIHLCEDDVCKLVNEFEYRWGMGENEPPFNFKMIVYNEANLPQRLYMELRNRKFGRWEENVDGTFTYYDQVIDYDSLKAWVMGLGASVKVLEPQRLKEEIIRSARKRVHNYEMLE